MFTPSANEADRAFNYGRVEIASGAMSYVSWKSPYAWAVDSEVHLRQWIDADTDEQTLEIHEGGVLQWSMTGDVPYYDPALTTDGLYLHLGTQDADWGLHYSPHGWTFSNLLVCAWEAG